MRITETRKGLISLGRKERLFQMDKNHPVKQESSGEAVESPVSN